MDNLFDSANYPTAEPGILGVGDRWAWTRPDITTAYPTASYTLKYRFIGQEAGGSVIEIVADKVVSAHVVTVATTVTIDYAPGTYEWQAIVVRDSDSEEVVVSRGYSTLKASTGDTRPWTYRVLMAIRATIEGTASKEDSSYSIAGRSLSRRSVSELLELEKEFQARWTSEQAAVDRAEGRTPAQRRVLMKFGA